MATPVRDGPRHWFQSCARQTVTATAIATTARAIRSQAFAIDPSTSRERVVVTPPEARRAFGLPAPHVSQRGRKRDRQTATPASRTTSPAPGRAPPRPSHAGAMAIAAHTTPVARPAPREKRCLRHDHHCETLPVVAYSPEKRQLTAPLEDVPEHHRRQARSSPAASQARQAPGMSRGRCFRRV